MSTHQGFLTCRALLLGGLLLLVGPPLPAGRSFYVAPLTADHTLAPGSVVTDRLLVVNNDERPASFSITAHDFTTDTAGVDTYRSLGSHSRSLADWITFTPSFLTLPPRGKGFIEYEIRVPGLDELDSQAPLPEGSYWAAIMVQTERERKVWEQAPKDRKVSRFGIGVAFVYAIKIYLNIQGTERSSLKAVSLTAGGEPRSLVATFANTGNVIVRPKVWMELRDLEGAVLATLDSLTWTLEPGMGHDYRFSVQDVPEPLPDGRYQVAVIADYGAPRLCGLMAPLNLKGRGTSLESEE